MTVAGPATGEKCIFPFTLDGVTYTKCTKSRSTENIPWCSTKVDDDGVLIGRNFGDCSDECPIEGKRIFMLPIIFLVL